MKVAYWQNQFESKNIYKLILKHIPKLFTTVRLAILFKIIILTAKVTTVKSNNYSDDCKT